MVLTTLEEFQELLKIDKHDLDTALIDHPGLYYRVASQKAMAVSRRDEAKQELDELEAQTDLDLREDFARQGTKITEALMEKHVAMDSDVQAAQKKLLRTKREAEMWSALADAFSQRAFMLKDLCALYIAGYWGQTSAEGEARQGARERNAAEARAGSYSARRGTQE